MSTVITAECTKWDAGEAGCPNGATLEGGAPREP